MPDPISYLKASIAALIASAMIVLAFRLILRRSVHSAAAAICVLAVGVGAASGFGVLQFLWTWPPTNGLNRFLMIVLPATVIVELLAAVIGRDDAMNSGVRTDSDTKKSGFLHLILLRLTLTRSVSEGHKATSLADASGYDKMPRRVSSLAARSRCAIGLRLALYASVGRILLHDSVYLGDVGSGNPDAWTIALTVAVFGGSFAGLIAVWKLLRRLSERSASGSISISLALAMQCTGLATMMAGYIKGGAAAIPLSAALAGTALASLLLLKGSGSSDQRYLQGAIGIGVIGLFSLLCIGHYFGQLTGPRAIVLFMTPLLCWISEVPGLRTRPAWQKSCVRLIAVIIALAALLFFAKQDFDRKLAPLLAGVSSPETGLHLSSGSKPDF